MAKHKISRRPIKIKTVSAEADKTDVVTQEPKLVSSFLKSGGMMKRSATMFLRVKKLKKK